MPEETLHRLEWAFAFPLKGEASWEEVERVAARLGYEAKASSPSQHIVDGALLFAAEHKEHVLWFHADKMREEDGGEDEDENESKDVEEKESLFVHLVFREKPKTPPPEKVKDLHSKGVTVEWFLGELARLAATSSDDKLAVVAEARFTLTGWSKKNILIAAQPLTTGSSILALSGAEYTAKSIREGVKRFRWSEEDEKITVSLSYFLRVPAEILTHDLVPEQRDQCLGYLKDLF